jgi:hypothetical protein
LKAFKKEFACNGSLVDDEDMGQVIQLQGDQRTKIHDMLVEEGISELEDCVEKRRPESEKLTFLTILCLTEKETIKL